MIGWLLLSMALGSGLDGLSPVARDLYERGQSDERRGALARAATAYRMVWSQEPGWTRALLDEARVLHELERSDEALSALGRAPFVPDVIEARGRLLLELDRGEDAAETFRRLPPEWEGVDLLVAQALVAEAPLEAAAALEAALDDEARLDEEVVVALAPTLVRALSDAGEDERAFEVAERVLRQVQAEEAFDILRAKVQERDVAAQAQRLARAAALPLSPLGITTLRDARAQLFAGDVAEAQLTLRALSELEPRAVTVWTARSVAEERSGDIAAAVHAARKAEQLNPLDADTSARVGHLLAEHYAGRMDVQAARAFGRAVQRRGADAELWWHKAELERRVKWHSASLESYRRVVVLDGDGEMARRASAIVDDLMRPVPPEVEVADGEGFRPSSVPEEAWESLHVAWAWQRRAEGDPDALERAQAEIARTLTFAPRWTRAVNLDAAIHLDRGDDSGALERYRRSLEIDGDQGAVWMVVASLLRQQGQQESAGQALEKAAALGEPEALLARAEGYARGWRLWAAQEDLERYRERSVDAPQRVEAVERAIRAKGAGVAVAGLGGAFAIVGLPLAMRRRRRAGVGLDAVLQRDARSFPEVARILAAIRHEVIKHHTTVLDAVADALEVGDEGPADWAEERLFAPEGAVPAYDHYLAELHGVAERQGLRLNLRYADPELAPMVEGMAALKAIEGRLATQSPAHLRALSEQINGVGYRALGRRVRALCQQRVDRAFVDEAWALACRELEHAPPFEVDVLPEQTLVVRMFRQDLLDVIVNLMRNAVQANEATGGGRVGVAVDVEDDWITGIESVVIQVRDDSELRLDTEQLRGRFLGRGLGLAVDRVTQAGGSIRVEEVPGWAKSVTVRLNRLETDGQDAGIGPTFGGAHG